MLRAYQAKPERLRERIAAEEPKLFQADYPEAQCLLLSFRPEPLLIDGIRCEPLEGWLRQLRP